MTIDETGQRTLLQVARDAIAHGLAKAEPPRLASDEFPEPLRQVACSFVTLHKASALRGCIGSLHAHRPLVSDVAMHAFAAAFSDARFDPVAPTELAELHIHVSILSELELVTFDTEANLVASLRPGVHGLLIESGGRRGTFLPTVWSSIPEGRDFLTALKRKAGLEHADGYVAWRYTTQDFAED